MSEESRLCYICLGDEGGEEEWVSPCRCSGTIKWVHRSCLMRWIKEHESTRPLSSASCPQCGTRFRLIPGKGALVMILEFIDTKIYPACKYYAACLIGIVAYDTVFIMLGIITQSLVNGLEETLLEVTKSDKRKLTFICFYLSSLMLLIVNSIAWERKLLEALRECSRLPGIGRLFPEEVPERFKLPENNQESLARIAVNSALLPFISKLVGNTCFFFVDSRCCNLTRMLFGGLLFLAVKGVSYMYLLQKLEVRRKRMIITPYQSNPT